MTRVSRFPIEKDVIEDITQIFYQLIGDLEGFEVGRFLDDFLTEEERLMLSKRLAVALLIHKGFDYPEIKLLLKVSNGTISGTKGWLRRKNGLRLSLDKIEKREKANKFEQKAKELLKHLPPITRSAKDRARWLNR